MLNFLKNTFRTTAGIIIPAQALILGVLLFVNSSGLCLEQQLVSLRWWTVLAWSGAVLMVMVLVTGIWAQLQLLEEDCPAWVYLVARLGTLVGGQILYWLAHMGQNFSQRTGLVLDWGWLAIYDQSVLDQKRATYLEAMIKVYNASFGLQCVPSQAQHLQKLSLKGLENQLTSTELIGLTLDQISMLATHTARQLIMLHMQGAPLLTFAERFKFVYTPSFVQWVSDHPLTVGGGILFSVGLIFTSGFAIGWIGHAIAGEVHLPYEQALSLIKYCAVARGAYHITDPGLALVILPGDGMFGKGVIFYISSLISTLFVGRKLAGLPGGLLDFVEKSGDIGTGWIVPVTTVIATVLEIYSFESNDARVRAAKVILDEVKKQLLWYYYWFSRNG